MSIQNKLKKLNIFKRLSVLEEENARLIRLIKALECDYTNKINKLNDKVCYNSQNIDTVNSKIINQAKKALDMAETLNKTSENLMKHFNISADIDNSKYHKNWMVFSIQGKPNYVAFRELSQRDIREIASFLKQFEGCNRTIDTPIGMEDIFLSPLNK